MKNFNGIDILIGSENNTEIIKKKMKFEKISNFKGGR